MGYAEQIIIQIAIFAILASSYDIVFGYAGIFSVAHAAFFGIGAYAAALLSIHATSDLILSIVVGMVAAAALSAVVGLAAMRLGGDYLLVASFGFQTIFAAILLNAQSITGGFGGIAAIPPVTVFGLSIVDREVFTLLVLVVAALSIGLLWRLGHSPFGRMLLAVQANEVAVRAAGRSATVLKVKAFTLGGAFAAIAGVLYAFNYSYVSPAPFTVEQSILILVMVVIGGAGTILGPLAGAAVLVLLPEGLRQIGVEPSDAGYIREALYGVVLVLVVMFRPQGMFGRTTTRDRLIKTLLRRTPSAIATPVQNSAP